MEEHTTTVVQRYLSELGDDRARDEAVRKLLARAVRRLGMLCGVMLKKYSRLTKGPMNLDEDELLSTVVERLLKAMRKCKPATAREFFGLANQHVRWALNDLAERLDKQPVLEPLPEVAAPEGPGGETGVSPQLQRIVAAIDSLPREESEVFDLIKIQGLTHTEAADILGIASKTVQRRLNRALLSLAERLTDLAPS